MKALLLKDWFVIRSQYKFYILLYLFIAVIGLLSDSGYMNAYCMIIMSTVSTNLLQNDETCRFLTYADITPLTRKQVVAEKYVMNLLLIGTTSLLSVVSHLLGTLLHQNMAERLSEMLTAVCLFTAVGTLMTEVTFPLLFRWGTMRGKVMALVVYGSIAGILSAGYVGMTLQWFIGNEPVQIPVLAVIAAVCLLVLYPLSYLLAVRWYERRELV